MESGARIGVSQPEHGGPPFHAVWEFGPDFLRLGECNHNHQSDKEAEECGVRTVREIVAHYRNAKVGTPVRLA